jgi:hypothetical protein
MNSDRRYVQLIEYLRSELVLSEEAIAVALKHPELEIAPLPMILWQYGLVTLDQLNTIFDWLSDRALPSLNTLLQ